MFELFLFSKKKNIIKLGDRGGVNGYVIDWENKGKTLRQKGYDTQISTDTYDDLREVRKFTDNHIICRINNVTELIDEEIEKAISFGADEILVPMVRSVGEIEILLEKAANRCHLAVMVETRDAISNVKFISKLPVTRIFLGLQDLAVDSGYTNIFKPLCDDTIDLIRKDVDVPFGFGGATLPHKGYPLPCYLLMSELVRLNCNFTFLRRAFHKDVLISEIPEAIHQIRGYFETTRKKSQKELDKNRELLIGIINESDNYFNKVNAATTQ